MKKFPANQGPLCEAGFTLIESMLVFMLIAIIGGMSTMMVQASMPHLKSNAAVDQVMSAMRLAQAAAIKQRRPIEVRMTPPNRLDLVRLNVGGGETPVTSVILESNPLFMLSAGVPDSPDAFGNATAFDFGGAAIVQFLADGSLADGGAIPLNGTIFLGAPDTVLSARAVTVTGATGRAMAYRWNGSRWEER